MITFPHMGNLHIVLKALISGLGQQPLVPPPITKQTLELGEKYSPEAACLPFKITLGNFIEALEQGADNILMCGGVGPCRLGYYAEIQKGILNDLGYKFNMVAIEPSIVSVYNNIRLIARHKSWREIYAAFRLAAAKMYMLDKIEHQVTWLRSREKVPGTIDAVYSRVVEKIDAACSLEQMSVAQQVFNEQISGLEQKKNVRPLRIGFIGEIYVMLEPFVNYNLVKRLGSMGADVYRSMSLSDYVKGNLLRQKSYQQLYTKLAELANPYLGHYVGGHGLKSVGCTVQMGQAGLDGVIQVYPFACMPEVIAKNILSQVSEDKDIPVLSLAFDEQTGEAGVVTRLEAFLDLLEYRRYKAVNN